MYPGKYGAQHPDRPAFIMAESGETVSYRDYEARCNKLAHLLRARGLARLDHYAIFMENHVRYLETCGAGERAGHYYTCINSYLTAEEVAYIVNNSESQVLITSEYRREVAMAALADCPNVRLCIVVDGPGDGDKVVNLDEATAEFPDTPIPDESLGTAMLYSSGTTGQPKGILRPLPENLPDNPLPVFQFLMQLWQLREDIVLLLPAPLYHSAPHAAVNFTIRMGGTSIIMERFDPELYLSLVEKYQVTDSQMVPTMFSRMLKLPEEVRNAYDVSSLQVVVHGAAPCPVQVKQQMIDWWGPVIDEYYGATEAQGVTFCNSAEWLAHPGTVGQVKFGQMHIFDDDMQPCPTGPAGTVWFVNASEFEYFNDAERTKEAYSPDRTMSTVGDMGYVDDEGYLYLTDRATFMIVSGGVNIYPQECENLLITHPKVMDAAVFGVPNEDFGEEVKAVVQTMPNESPGDALVDELMAFCREHLATMKCPRSIDFMDELPRLPTGKLYKRVLRDRYWGDRKSRIL
ncbi:MAG: AMP-binding protein [Rhodospirillaceae bacterium]|nr:AMP-binding protein [Rhodospirillaceae bacterium]